MPTDHQEHLTARSRLLEHRDRLLTSEFQAYNDTAEAVGILYDLLARADSYTAAHRNQLRGTVRTAVLAHHSAATADGQILDFIPDWSAPI